MGRLAWICAAVLAAACGFNPTGGMPGDDAPDIDAADEDDAGVDAAVETDGAVCTARCQGAQLVTCTGGVEDPPVTCAAGCLTSGTPHCGVLVPSNGASAADLGAAVTAELLVANGRVVVLDSDTGAITSYQGTAPTPIRAAGANVNAGIRYRVQLQSGGAPDLAVFAVDALTIEDGGTLKVAGGRPVLLLVDGVATIAGGIDIGAGRSGAMLTTECQTCAGAGGGNGATTLAVAAGCAPGGNGAFDLATDETGGAGGGLGVTGAAGGDSDADGGDFSALSACPGPALVPLQGGSGGGRGGFDSIGVFGGLGGGGGGGAMQITSMTSIALSATADLYAGGAGGLGSTSDYGGGGGGAGGAFLLEAPTVTVTSNARITANGGGGGAGRTANRGENGARSETQRASGGAGDGSGQNDGRGGLGGISSTSGATQGNGNVDGTGGGGGGAGILRINTVSTLTVPAGAVVSPPHTAGTAAVQ